MNTKRRYTDEQFIEAVKNNYSVAGVLRTLKLSPVGGSYQTVYKLVQKLQLDISHFTGSGHLKGKTHSWSPARPLKEILVNGTNYSSHKLKKRLIKTGLLINQCSICGINEWQGNALSLELDHIDGDHFNNELINLRLLCPNCHSLTPTYCGKNNRGKYLSRLMKQKKFDEMTIVNICLDSHPINEKTIKNSLQISCLTKPLPDHKLEQHHCLNCEKLNHQPKINWPSLDKLITLIEEARSFLAAGKILGVSDNAIRKYLKRQNIDPKSIKTARNKI